MSKLANNPLDIKSSLLKTKNSNFDFNLEAELKEMPPQEEIIEEVKEEKKEVKKVVYKKETEEAEARKQKSYRLPTRITEAIDKIVYMDRELRGNETTLVAKALEHYINMPQQKKLIEEYNELKGIK